MTTISRAVPDPGAMNRRFCSMKVRAVHKLIIIIIIIIMIVSLYSGSLALNNL